jgi:hypothetical protein
MGLTLISSRFYIFHNNFKSFISSVLTRFTNSNTLFEMCEKNHTKMVAYLHSTQPKLIVQIQNNYNGSMCHIMYNNEVRGNLFPCLCNHLILNALKQKIKITFKTNPFGSHVKIGEAKPYLAITSKLTRLMLSEFTFTSTFSNVDKNETCFQFYITYMWILMHYCTSIMVTSSALTLT